MGRALADGWVASGYDPASIAVVDESATAAAQAARAGFHAGAADSPDVVVLAVKPGQLDAALRPRVGSGREAVFLSIAAGRTIASIERILGAGSAIVRAMPNTPATIGRGVTGLFASAGVSGRQKELCGELMAAVGKSFWVEDERLMDVVTAVSGSGPAYVFLLIEALTEAGKALGLDASLAAGIATGTVAGAGEYAAAAGIDAAELRRRVTSPNGTTQAALEVLMNDDALARLLFEAVDAATRRSRELAG